MIIEEWDNTELEKNQILKIIQKVFPNSEFATSEYFDWQYRDGPHGPAKILLAKDDDENIIGVESILPMKLIIDGKDVVSSLSCNSIVDPNFRNQGIFSKLVSNILELVKANEISSIYGIPNTKSCKIFLKSGFTQICELPLLVKPLKLSNYFPSPVKQIIKPFEIFWKIKKGVTDIQLFKGEINSDFEKIVDDLAKRISVLQKRDSKYLEWRYNNHPSRKYEIHILKEKTELKGYIITRIANINEKKVGIILDFVYDSKIKNKEGPKGLEDKRKGNSGRKHLLSRKQQEKLLAKLQKEPPDGGIWTGPKVASWVEDQIGSHVSNVTGWQYLRMLGFTLQVPRLAHSAAATPAERTVWKKNWKSQS
ncbi:MAG: GNAT family N-acetyltransferase [Thaumarchaeota archaeon]|nr:GNAT family N-acetyltransferase [Nitrososphaerota archaeon]